MTILLNKADDEVQKQLHSLLRNLRSFLVTFDDSLTYLICFKDDNEQMSEVEVFSLV